MTTPGGVPNLPHGALTLDTLADKLQDMSPSAMHNRAADQMPNIFDLSTGGNILSDLTPFGIITRIWAEFNSLVANADPADIQGPDDLPGLLLDFINGLPGWFIAFAKRILLALLEFARAIPVLSDLIAPFLDAIEDLVNDIPETLLGFLDPIAWAKRLLRFASQFVRGIPVLGTQIAPFLDAVDGLVDGVTDSAPMLNLLNPLTWMGWISDGFLSQFGLDFGWLSGLTGVNLGSGSDFFSGILGILGNPAGLMTGNPILGPLSSIPLFLPLLSGLVGGGGLLPINVGNLFGSLPGHLFSSVPIGSLTNSVPNLLPQGLFPPGSIAPGDSWTVDPTRTATADSTGSGHHVADGRNHALRSIPIAIAPDKTLNLSVKAWWTSFVSTGTPIQLSVLKFKNDVEVGREILASVAASGTSSAWTTLSAPYTSPADGSVDTIKLRPVISSAATAGEIWFDDAQIGQPSVIKEAWVGSLLDRFTGIKNLFGLSFLDDLIGLNPFAVWTALISSGMNPFEAAWNTLYNVFGGLVGSSGKTLSSILTIGKTFFDVLASGSGANFTQLTTRFTEILQLGQVLSGTSVTPITSLISSVLTRIQYIGTSGVFSATGIPVLDQSKVSNLPADLAARVPFAGTNGFQDLLDNLQRFFSGGSGPASGSTVSSVLSWAESFFQILANGSFNLATFNVNQVENTQTKQVLAGQAITPISSLVSGIVTWYNAHF